MDYSKQFPNEPHGRNEIDMIFQNKYLEKEAYSYILGTFIAQSDLLSWAKEDLMTKLWHELNVTGSFVGKLNASRPTHNSMDHALSKKWKTYAFDSIFCKQEPYGQASVLPFPIPAPSDDKGRGIAKSERKIGYNMLRYFDHLNKGPDVIEIRETKKLLREIERVIYGRDGIVPAHVEMAQLILEDHEESLLSALAKLPDVSDDVSDNPPDQMLHRYNHRDGEVHKTNNKQ